MIQEYSDAKYTIRFSNGKKRIKGKQQHIVASFLHDTIHLRNKVHEHSLLFMDFSDLLFLLKPANFEETWHPPKDLATPKCINPTR